MLYNLFVVSLILQTVTCSKKYFGHPLHVLYECASSCEC